jgi:hypothetical protein
MPLGTARDLATMRAFVDPNGVEWTVREIANPAMRAIAPDRLAQPQYQSGWLVFESADGKRRRLAPYPSDWRSFSDGELIWWCQRAAEVTPRLGTSRPEDHTSGSGA